MPAEKARHRITSLTLLVALAAGLAAVVLHLVARDPGGTPGDADTPGASEPAPAPSRQLAREGFVEFPATSGDEFQMGRSRTDTADLLAGYVDTLRSPARLEVWEDYATTWHPQHGVALAVFGLARYEAPTAAWTAFVAAESNHAIVAVPAGATLDRVLQAAERIGAIVCADERDRYLQVIADLNPAAVLHEPHGGDAVADVRVRPAATLRVPLVLPTGAAADGRDDDSPDRAVGDLAWAEAFSMARWVGYRLPTEAEWERAAAGLQQRNFPWGNDWRPDATARSSRSDFPDIEADDSRPAGATPEGVHHMAGNVDEWVLDRALPYPGGRPVRGLLPRCHPVSRGGSRFDVEPPVFFTFVRGTNSGGWNEPSRGISATGCRFATTESPGTDAAISAAFALELWQQDTDALRDTPRLSVRRGVGWASTPRAVGAASPTAWQEADAAVILPTESEPAVELDRVVQGRGEYVVGVLTCSRSAYFQVAHTGGGSSWYRPAEDPLCYVEDPGASDLRHFVGAVVVVRGTRAFLAPISLWPVDVTVHRDARELVAHWSMDDGPRAPVATWGRGQLTLPASIRHGEAPAAETLLITVRADFRRDQPLRIACE